MIVSGEVPSAGDSYTCLLNSGWSSTSAVDFAANVMTGGEGVTVVAFTRLSLVGSSGLNSKDGI